MNRHLYLFFSLLACVSLVAGACSKKKSAEISFKESTVDFNATQGEKVKAFFPFTNKGTDSLEIISVHASCDCTVANYTAGKIAAGEAGQIEVTYDSSRDLGEVKKQVLVETNTIPALTPLSITGNVRKF